LYLVDVSHNVVITSINCQNDRLKGDILTGWIKVFSFVMFLEKSWKFDF